MDVRPIDVQLMMNSSEVNKAAETGKYAQQQQFFADHLEQETQQEAQKTVASSKTEGQTISDKDESSRQHRERQNKQRRKSRKDEQKPKAAASTSLFDVKI